MQKIKERQRENVEGDFLMKNRVGDAEGLTVEEPKYDLPVPLSYQTKY